MTIQVHAVHKPKVPPFEMSDRFRHDIAYFAVTPGEPGAPEQLGANEYWVRLEEARRILDEGVIRLVSPLDSATTAEIEISEEQEAWLEWMIAHGIEHVRLSK